MSKDTSYLKAIHNPGTKCHLRETVVSMSKDTSYLKAIHNALVYIYVLAHSCFKEQRYKFFENNSQLSHAGLLLQDIVSTSKDTSYLKAIHINYSKN